MTQVASTPVGSTKPFTPPINCGDPVPSTLTGYVNLSFPAGAATVLTVDGSGTLTAEPLGAQGPSKTQYFQVAAPAKGPGILQVQAPGGPAFWFECVTGLQ